MKNRKTTKNKKTALYWLIFFAVTILLLNAIVLRYSEPREIIISDMQAHTIGHKIWMNDSGGKLENLILWNEGEKFPTFGIGHFIWYPQGIEHDIEENFNESFDESFPELLQYISTSRTLPPWLLNREFPPWDSRDAFITERQSSFSIQLKIFLLDTFGEQTQFMIFRLENSLPMMLKEIKNSFAREKVRENFYRVANKNNGAYALLDYINFTNQRISVVEKYKGQAWGLMQVLEHMKGNTEQPVQEFVDAANFVLTRHEENASPNERHRVSGWRKRIQTYLE